MNADRNLLLGILALQNNFINRQQLVAAFDLWLTDKSRALGQLLFEQGALADDERALLEALVAKHLQRHEDDPEKSLADLTPVDSVRDDLERLEDRDVQASLARLAAPRDGNDDPTATCTWRAGEVTAPGGRFRVLRPHARGGLGEVYVARDEELHREVALKEIQARYADDPNSRSRFLLEAEITGGLEHPGIVPVYGLGTYADGRPFYAMRFIKGDSLKDGVEGFHNAVRDARVAFTSLQFRKLLGRFVDVCNAIEYAHSRGVLHRDLKPGNIMLGKYGETLVVDWGLAKVVGRLEPHASADEMTLRPSSASGSAPTEMGSAVGTPQYMSPEQAEGRLDQLGPATDVYSLGATLYMILTGRPPFRSAELVEVLVKVAKGEFPQPTSINAAVPRALEAVCLKAMALRPGDRYPSPRALADDLEHWMADEPVGARPDTLVDRAARWSRRHRALARSAAVALVVISAVSITAAFVVDKARQDERTARVAADRAADREREQAKRAEDEKQKAILAGKKARQEAQRAEANRIEAERQTGIAQRHARVSEALRLAGESRRERPERPVRSVLLALEAVRLAGDQDDALQALNESILSIQGEPLAFGTTPRLLTLSPEGDWLATGNARGTIRLWNVTDYFDALAFKPDISPVTDLAFSADGHWLASAHSEGAVRLWNLTHRPPDGAPVVLKTPGTIPALLRFSTDGAWLVGCDDIGTIRAWDVRHADSAPLLLHQEAKNQRVVWRDGERLIWRDEPGAEHIKFSPDGRWLAAVTDDSNLSVWSFPPTEAEPRRYTFKIGTDDLPSFDLPIFSFNADSRWLATVGNDWLRLWDLAASDPSAVPLLLEKCSGENDGGDRPTFQVGSWLPSNSSLAFSADGHWLATCKREDGWSTRLWHLTEKNPAETPLTLSGSEDDNPLGLAFSSDGRWLVQNCQDRLRLWNMSALGTAPVSASLTLRAEALHAEGHIFVMFELSGEGRYLAAGSDDGSVRVWDLTAEDPAGDPYVLHGHDSPITRIVFVTEDNYPTLTTASEDGAVRLWNGPGGRFRGSPTTPLMSRARAVALAGREFTKEEIAEYRINRGESTGPEIANSQASNGARNSGISDALRWVADHQRPDGSWSFDHRSVFLCDGQCGNPGKNQHDVRAATGLALRTLLGAVRTDINTIYQENIYRGLYWFGEKDQIGAYGLTDGWALRKSEQVVGPGSLFSHAICTTALCEAYAVTHDPQLAAPGQAAISFLAHTQDKASGGWGRSPSLTAETSVLGWHILALKCGYDGLLHVDNEILAGATRFLDSVQGDGGATYGDSSPGSSPLTDAIGLASRLYLGWERGNPTLVRGARRISERGPTTRDMLYTYFATLLMHQFDGPDGPIWTAWRDQTRAMLLGSQSQVGHEKGSWLFEGDDPGFTDGGRLYCTVLALSTLEIENSDLVCGKDIEVPTWSTLAENAPYLADALVARGNARAEAGRWKEATADFARAAELKPSAADWPLYLKTTAELASGDIEACRQSWRELFDRFKGAEDAKPLERIASAFIAANPEPEVSGEIVRLLEQQKATPQRLSLSGGALFRNGKYVEALRHLQPPTLRPTRPHTEWLLFSMASLKNQQFAAALESFQAAIQLRAGTWWERVEADALRAEAERLFEEAIGQTPNADDFTRRANFLIAAGRWREAAEDFGQVAKLEPATAYFPLYFKATAYLAMGDRKGYRETWRELYDRFKDSDGAGIGRILYAFVSGNPEPDLSAEMVRLAEQDAQANPASKRILGAALYRDGQYQSAIAGFTEAAKHFPPRAWDHLFMALAQARTGNVGDARAAFNAASVWTRDSNNKMEWYEHIEVNALEKEALEALPTLFHVWVFRVAGGTKKSLNWKFQHRNNWRPQTDRDLETSDPLEALRYVRSQMLAGYVAASNADVRKCHRWTYTDKDGVVGEFRQVDGHEWVENKEGNPHAHFKEVARTKDFVELHDASRSISLRLWAVGLYSKAADSDWELMPFPIEPMVEEMTEKRATGFQKSPPD